MNKGKKVMVTDKGYCFSYFTELAREMGYPEAACEFPSLDIRNGLENGEWVTVLEETDHPSNGEVDPATNEVLDYGKLFIVQSNDCRCCQYIISEKGLQIS